MVLHLCFHALFRAGFVLDNEDRSVTRSDLYFKELFSRCGLHVYKSKVNCTCFYLDSLWYFFTLMEIFWTAFWNFQHGLLLSYDKEDTDMTSNMVIDEKSYLMFPEMLHFIICASRYYSASKRYISTCWCLSFMNFSTFYHRIPLMSFTLCDIYPSYYFESSIFLLAFHHSFFSFTTVF